MATTVSLLAFAPLPPPLALPPPPKYRGFQGTRLFFENYKKIIATLFCKKSGNKRKYRKCPARQFPPCPAATPFAGFLHLAGGLIVGLSGLASGVLVKKGCRGLLPSEVHLKYLRIRN